MGNTEAFFWGAFGSFEVKVVAVFHVFLSTKPHPSRYQNLGFWITRILLVGVAGGLAIAYGIDKPIVAVHVGASAPIIITSFSQTQP
jgi:phage shock protein PspC (stress-responsive transcriptional regulator)